MDKLRAMNYFCEVAQCGSFSAAARAAGVPVSSLSRSLQSLEAQLGAQLLKRSTRHVQLTEIGRLYLTHCRDILAAVNLAEGRVVSYQSSPSGVLRISALPMYADLKLLPILDEFQDLYPDIILDLDLSNQVSDLNRDGVDIAIRGGGLPDERVIAQYIDSNQPVFCGAPQYIESHGYPKSVADLSEHKALLYRAPQRVLNWGIRTGGNWKPVEIPAALISNGGNIMLQALLAGKGLGLIPRWCIERELKSGAVVEIPFKHELSTTADVTVGVYMLYQRPHYTIPKVRVAVDFFKSKLQSGRESVLHGN